MAEQAIMSATRGFLATAEPCADPRRTSCDWEPGMLRSCHRCRGDLTRTVLHPDTPAISVEAVLAIIDSELSGWEQSVTVPTRIATYAIDALREIRDRIEAPT